MKKALAALCALTLALAAVPPGLAAGPAKKYIALTFDDGPNTTTTMQVLDVLEEHGVPATFFLIGQNIDARSAGSVRRALSLGCEIGCHSQTHSYMDRMTREEIRAEIAESSARIEQITGEKPRFFRPPYIAVNDLMFDEIDMIFISGIGCDDWDPAVTTGERVAAVRAGAADGAIILLHDSPGNTQTVEAIRILIPGLRAEGCEFVTLSELFALEGVTPVRRRVYSNARQTGQW